MMNQTLGSRIAELRRKKNMTQEELAAELGVTPQGRQQMGKRSLLPRYHPAAAAGPAVRCHHR